MLAGVACTTTSAASSSTGRATRPADPGQGGSTKGVRRAAVDHEHLAGAGLGKGENCSSRGPSRPYDAAAAAVGIEGEHFPQVVEQSGTVCVLGRRLGTGEGEGIRRAEAADRERSPRGEVGCRLLVRHRHRQPDKRHRPGALDGSLQIDFAHLEGKGTSSQGRARR